MSPTIDLDELLSNAEAASAVKQQPDTMTAWRHLGKGPPYYKIGRQVFYRRGDLEEWVVAQRRQPTRVPPP